MALEFRRWIRWRFASEEGGKRRRRWVILCSALLAGLSGLIYLLVVSPLSLPPSPEGMSTEEQERETPPPQDRPHRIMEGRVKEKSSFFKALAEQKISPVWIELIVSTLRPYVDFKRIKGGSFRFAADAQGDLLSFVYEAGPTEVYEVEKGPEGYSARRRDIPLDRFLVKVVGQIRSSLFEAMDEVGEEDRLGLAFAEVLAWEIDFYKDVKEGDRFKIVVEKIYKGDQFIRYGPIHAVEYQRGQKVIRGIAYQDDYYNDQGISLRKAFLKAPLRFNRISSKFSRSRKHPILGGVLPHFGVDYAAPPGTPVWAVADGTVVSSGWGGGFGKQVILRHMNGYKTYYGHLSSYGPGIKKGAHVKQKQIIGYVGSTGLSTGPHLDYRLAKDGGFRNPLKEMFPVGVPIQKTEMQAYQRRREDLIVWLEGDTPFKRDMNDRGDVP